MLLCPILLSGKGGIPSSTYVSNTEQNRFAIIAVGEYSSSCFRIDTKTGAVSIIDVSENGDKTAATPLTGNELVKDSESRNGRFQAYIAPYPSEFNIILIDTDTGRIRQSNHKKKTLIEIPSN